MKIISLRMGETLMGALKKAAEKRGLNVSSLIRMILIEWLEENSK